MPGLTWGRAELHDTMPKKGRIFGDASNGRLLATNYLTGVDTHALPLLPARACLPLAYTNPY